MKKLIIVLMSLMLVTTQVNAKTPAQAVIGIVGLLVTAVSYVVIMRAPSYFQAKEYSERMEADRILYDAIEREHGGTYTNTYGSRFVREMLREKKEKDKRLNVSINKENSISPHMFLHTKRITPCGDCYDTMPDFTKYR